MRQSILREVPEVEPGPERLLVLWASVLVMVSLALSAGFCNTARHHISACKECIAIRRHISIRPNLQRTLKKHSMQHAV